MLGPDEAAARPVGYNATKPQAAGWGVPRARSGYGKMNAVRRLVAANPDAPELANRPGPRIERLASRGRMTRQPDVRRAL
jgi:hypothetical protein